MIKILNSQSRRKITGDRVLLFLRYFVGYLSHRLKLIILNSQKQKSRGKIKGDRVLLLQRYFVDYLLAICLIG